MYLNKDQILEDRYRIDALLGQGGMGAVYQATDLRFNAAVAIKENRMITPESQKQFTREAGLLYRLRHPNLPRVIDHFSIPRQGQYLVMDFIEGDDLKQILSRRGPVPEPQALRWMNQVLEALEYLHGENIIHRDVKPANVKITPHEEVFLVDFGLAKRYDPLQQTTVGARGVTPGYAPPEQYGQGRTDARSDIYSAAATLYDLLTGQAPPDALAFMTRQAEFLPPRQLNPRISPHVEAAILRAMQMVPEDRFQTVAALREALQEPPIPVMEVEPADAQAPTVPVAEPEPEAPPPEASAAARVEEPPPTEAMAASEPAVSGVAEAAPAPPRLRWKRVVLVGLLAAVLGAASTLMGADPMGFIGVGLVVLGLLAYHASRVPPGPQRQYQVEAFSMWLGVAIAYLVVSGDEPSAVFLGTMVLFWLPSALLGAIVLWLVRRRARRKQG
jgi:hypothetical protein